MKKINVFLSVVSFLIVQNCIAQPAEKKFTHADTLRGSVTPERAWWDVLRYDIDIKPDYNNKTVEGRVKIIYRITEDLKEQKALPKRLSNLNYKMQIDLQEPLVIDKIIKTDNVVESQDNIKKAKYIPHTSNPKYDRMGNVYILTIEPLQLYQKNQIDSITIYYHGKPREAVRPP